MTLASLLKQWFGERIQGPAKPEIGKVNKLNIRMIMIKLENGIDMKMVRQYLAKARTTLLSDKRFSTLTAYYDVDPL